MPKAIMGNKAGMTQVFSADGKVIPVTVVEVKPCVVSQIKTKENDGYCAIQISYGELKPGNVNKPKAGHFAKAGAAPRKYMKEVRMDDVTDYQLGQEIKADIFTEGEKIDVIGKSKGKGFAGTIKRWNQHRGPMGHGSKNHRRPASAGAKGPARVFKGKHSPGRMGGEQITVQNLEIVKVDVERNILLIKGAVPGPKNGLLMIKSAVKVG